MTSKGSGPPTPSAPATSRASLRAPVAVGATRAVGAVLLIGAAGFVVWMAAAGAHSVTSTYGSLGGGWWQPVLGGAALLGALAGWLAGAAVRLALRTPARTVAVAVPIGVLLSLGAAWAGSATGSAEHDRVTGVGSRLWDRDGVADAAARHGAAHPGHRDAPRHPRPQAEPEE